MTTDLPNATLKDDLGERTYRTVARRLLPVLGVCYFLSYLDRTNVSVAALEMNPDIGLSDAAFGLGAGLFFIGYFIFEVPSNLIMHKVGARIWMARIMVSWGIIAGLQAVVAGEQSFYIIRVLLGIAEAGFFPGMILYLSYWFPSQQRARVVGLFMAAIPISTAIGAPIGGLLLKMDGVAGIKGWQWLFIVEAVPTVIVGVMLFFWLTDRPKDADWLPEDQRAWLVKTLAAEEKAIESEHGLSVFKSMVDKKVLLLSFVYFAAVFGVYGLGFWLPSIIKGSLAIEDTLNITLLTAAPYVLGAIGMIFWGRYIDKKDKPRELTMLPLAIGGLTLGISAFISDPWIGYAGMFICAILVMTALPGFWRMPTAFLAGAAAAAGIAVVNSIGNLSGFAGPYWIGWIKEQTGSDKWGLATIGLMMILGALALLLVKHTNPRTEEHLADAEA